MKLSERDELKIGAAYQQLFHEEGRHPTFQEVYDFLQGTFTFVTIELFINSTEFQDKLIRLGIKTDVEIEGLLSPEQLLVANMELSTVDKRSMRQKLDTIDVSVQQYESWKRLPAYKAYIDKRARELVDTLEAEAYKTLAKAVAGNDLAAAKMILEMKGKYAKNINMNVNVEVVVMQLIEIVARHVTDPQILEAIARDFEQVNA